jgi:hypothetical protein
MFAGCLFEMFVRDFDQLLLEELRKVIPMYIMAQD